MTMIKQHRQSDINNDGNNSYGGDSNGDCKGNGDGDGKGNGNVSATTANGDDVDVEDGGIQGQR